MVLVLALTGYQDTLLTMNGIHFSVKAISMVR
ncbi:unnamed protein product [Rhizoctonia solani]|uniref:Uncharacterized protein n=1 Tax=Rhizoctonia solani TaxID=456999 RepID=A0A8H2XF19_9AGAM|nr:unnamed protein product [Rhizoctonia solani]